MTHVDKSKGNTRHGGARPNRWLTASAIALCVSGLVAWRYTARDRRVESISAEPTAGRTQGFSSTQRVMPNGAVGQHGTSSATHSAAASRDARERARAAIERALPEWDNGINQLSGDQRSKFDPSAQDALKLAELVTKEKFAFSEVRKNGRTVYKNKSQDSVVKVNPRTGYWKYISPLHESSNGRHALSDEQAESDALKLFDKFDLPKEEIGRVRSAGIAGAARGGDAEIVARSVRVGREVNGVPVDESEFTVTYNPDGSVARSERRWPSVELDGAEVATREEAVAQLTDALADDFASGDVEAGASLHYFYDEETGLHEPFLRVRVGAKGQDSIIQTVDYSLKDRAIDEGAPGEEHDS